MIHEPTEPTESGSETTGPAQATGPVEGPEPAPMPDPPTEIVEPAEPLERRYPSTIGGACYLLVLGATATAVVIAALGDWRLGVRVLAGALAGAGLLRLALPQRDAGMLAVRHRLLDVGLLAGVAAALWVLAGDIPDQPSLG